jgi:hypothetical protein
MPSTNRTYQLTPEERRQRLVAILATGLVRLGSTLKSPTSPLPQASENLSDSSANRLDVLGEQSVTVSAG